jgi:hypothetical protein
MARSSHLAVVEAAPEDWERSLKLMIDYRELKTDRPASSFYVNDFITQ